MNRCYSHCCIVIVVILVIVIIVVIVVIVNMEQEHGKALGRRPSNTWAPVRICTAISAIVVIVIIIVVIVVVDIVTVVIVFVFECVLRRPDQDRLRKSNTCRCMVC